MIRLLLLALVVGFVLYLVHRWRRDRREDALLRVRAAFLAPPSDVSLPRREPPPLRSVTLAEGRLRFHVPRAWDEEPAAAGMFEARASSGRRLRVELRARREGGPGVERLADDLRGSPAGRQGVVEVLPGERVLLKHVRTERAGDAHDVTYCWELAIPVAPAAALVAAFAFHVPAAAIGAVTEDDVRLLEQEIRGAALSAPV